MTDIPTQLIIDCGNNTQFVVPFSDEELQQLAGEQLQQSETLATQALTLTATEWALLRMKRDRWLAQTDYLEAFLNSPTTFAHLPAKIKDALVIPSISGTYSLTDNGQSWLTWRQALRDLPSGTVDPTAAIWPSQPPIPVIHLT